MAATSSRLAGDYATVEVPTVATNDTLATVRDALHGGNFEAAHDAVVVDDRRPIGLLPLEVLIAGDPSDLVRDVMLPAPPIVAASTDQEIAAQAMARAASRCLVVTDDEGRFLGLIPADRMLSVLLAEHDSDMARLGGYLAGATRARGAAQESIKRRLWHRLPWVLLGVLGAMGSALLVGAHDSQLEANVIVAFFIPAIVYMADAVGTQTETVLIRALAAGVTTRAIVARELVTGLVMGTVVGLVFFAFVAIGWGDVPVATAVGFALLASCSIATLVAMVLPTIFQRLGGDPAFGSGPLATVIQDLLSILVYFAVVAAIV
ncbi:MAG TPA: magnesium transporter [Thermoleophilaceae bacterium]|nr:magnesium transporter [Thermoleophilaceae bacterium]